VLARAGRGDWRAAAWALERMYPERWGRPELRAAASRPGPQLDDPWVWPEGALAWIHRSVGRRYLTAEGGRLGAERSRFMHAWRLVREPRALSGRAMRLARPSPGVAALRGAPLDGERAGLRT
jgi:hypothetical protein